MREALTKKYNNLYKQVKKLEEVKGLYLEVMLSLFPFYIRETFKELPNEIYVLEWLSTAFEIEGEFAHFKSSISWSTPNRILDKDLEELDYDSLDYENLGQKICDLISFVPVELFDDCLIDSDNNVLRLYRDGTWTQTYDSAYY